MGKVRQRWPPFELKRRSQQEKSYLIRTDCRRSKGVNYLQGVTVNVRRDKYNYIDEKVRKKYKNLDISFALQKIRVEFLH